MVEHFHLYRLSSRYHLLNPPFHCRRSYEAELARVSIALVQLGGIAGGIAPVIIPTFAASFDIRRTGARKHICAVQHVCQQLIQEQRNCYLDDKPRSYVVR